MRHHHAAVVKLSAVASHVLLPIFRLFPFSQRAVGYAEVVHSHHEARTTTEASSLSARRLALRPINSLLDTTIYSPSRLGDFHCRQPCLGFNGAWVKHSPPKRLRNASAVAGSGKQNRIWNCSTSCRLRPRRTGMRRSRWNASISRKTLRKPPGGNVSSTRCGKSRSFVSPMLSRLRRVILPNPPPLRASPPHKPGFTLGPLARNEPPALMAAYSSSCRKARRDKPGR